LAPVISPLAVRAGSQMGQLVEKIVVSRVEMLEATLAGGTGFNMARPRIPACASRPTHREFAERVLIGTGVFRHGDSPEDSSAAKPPKNRRGPRILRIHADKPYPTV